MKIIYPVLLLSLLAICSFGQTSDRLASAPNIIVIKSKWRFQVRNPALDENPFVAVDERIRIQQATIDRITQETKDKVQQETRETDAESRRRVKIRTNPIKPPSRPSFERNIGNASAAYIYEVKVKNTGEKTIRLLTLDYIFFEQDTKQEVGRRRFASKKNIAPGETKNLVFRSVAPPTGTINAERATKKLSDRFSEQVIIQSIENTDGSVWQAALNNQ